MKEETRRIRDPIKTQEKIRKHATAEFIRWGYEGARMDRISAKSGASKNLIYRYFDNKQELYIRCLEHVYIEFRKRQDIGHVDHKKPLDAIVALTSRTFDIFAEYPEILLMLSVENLSRGHFIKQSTIIPSLYNPLKESLDRIINEGKKQKIFRDQIDLEDLYISISALCYFYFSNRSTLSVIFGEYYAKQDTLAKRKAHVVDMVVTFVTGRAAT